MLPDVVNRLPFILQMVIRVVGLVVLVLGLVLWSHTNTSVQHAHVALGILLVLALWTLAALAAKSGVSVPLVAVAVAWGLIAPIVGLAQLHLSGGPSAAFKVVHLLIGLGVIGLGEALGARLKGSPAARRPA